MGIGMIKQITGKLITTYLLIIISIFVLLNVFGSKGLEKKLIQQQKLLLTQEAQMIAGEYGEDYVNDEITLQDLKRQLIVTDRFLNVRILLTNSSGVVFVDTRSAQRFSLQEHVDNFPAGNYYENFEDSDFTDEPLLVVWEPITYNEIVRGYVCLAVSMDAIQGDMLVYMNLFNIMYLVFIVVLFLFFVLLFMGTAYPMYHLKKAAIAYAKNDYAFELYPRLRGEYREVGAAVQYLAQEVQNLEDYRKKFIADISHDFRSPLTSIKGYSEAMLDGTIPPELHEKYISIVRNESDRLIKLTNSLLTLNNLNTEGMILEKTDFDINDVIRKTAATFEGTCRQKRISLQLILTGDELFAFADITKIQQVLYNLLDNAIKFSHKDSVIKIESVEKHNKIMISVKDQGIGIPKESIRQIWDRFYKTDLSRGKDKKGTGLGLSITREIIRAHGENINVISTEGEGSEFIFTLPLSDKNED